MVAPGRIGLKNDPAKSDGYTEILQRAGKDAIDGREQNARAGRGRRSSPSNRGARIFAK